MMEEIKEDTVLDKAVDDEKTYPHSQLCYCLIKLFAQKAVETTFMMMEGILQKEGEIKRGDDS